MCMQEFTHHVCGHRTISIVRCEHMSNLSGMLFCDYYNPYSRTSTTFCSENRLYCKDAHHGQLIDALSVAFKSVQSELEETDQLIYKFSQYPKDEPGVFVQPTRPGNILLTTSVSMTIQSLTRRRSMIVKELGSFVDEMRNATAVLVQQGLASGRFLQRFHDEEALSISMSRVNAPETPTPNASGRKPRSSANSFTTSFTPSQSIKHFKTPIVTKASDVDSPVSRGRKRVRPSTPVPAIGKYSSSSNVRRSTRLSKKGQYNYAEEDSPPSAEDTPAAESNDGSPRMPKAKRKSVKYIKPKAITPSMQVTAEPNALQPLTTTQKQILAKINSMKMRQGLPREDGNYFTRLASANSALHESGRDSPASAMQDRQIQPSNSFPSAHGPNNLTQADHGIASEFLRLQSQQYNNTMHNQQLQARHLALTPRTMPTPGVPKTYAAAPASRSRANYTYAVPAPAYPYANEIDGYGQTPSHGPAASAPNGGQPTEPTANEAYYTRYPTTYAIGKQHGQ